MKRKLGIFFIVLFIFIILSVVTTISPAKYANIKEMNSDVDKVLLIGHRGAAKLAPENTLSAIKEALKYTPDRIEVDIQQSKDGVLFLLHDETLERTTNAIGLMKDFTAEEIAGFEAGSFFDESFKNEKIPTLDEAFELINGQSVFLIEIKQAGDFYPQIEENLVKTIQKYNAHSWVIVHSFNTNALQRIHQLDSTIVLHKLFISKINFLPILYDGTWHWQTLKDFDYCTEFSSYASFINPHLINNVHAMGKKINAWTVNDTTEIQRLINMGVDGIITDVPNLAKPIIDRNNSK